MQTVTLALSEVDSHRRAMSVLRDGGLVAIPTDTVYGIAAMAFEGRSVARLYEVKRRSQGLAIPVFIASEEQLRLVAKRVPVYAQQLASRYWPGPLTMVLEGNRNLPREISSTGTVGVRIPDHPFPLLLLGAAGPLAVTSANISGEANAQSAEAVLESLGGKIELVIDGGRTTESLPSTVIDCTGDQPILIRQGPISMREILSSAGD